MAAWSYSSLTAWETCPRRYKITRIDKAIAEPQTDATRHGNEVHKALEVSVRDNMPLPPKYAAYEPIVKLVRASEGVKHTEHKFALTSRFTPVDYWAKDAWVRGVLDLRVVTPKTVVVLDWKAGKPKPDADQLKLFAAATFALHPHAEKVKTGYVWLGHNRVDEEHFHRGDEANVWREFLPRVQRMEQAVAKQDHPPRPSGLCRAWCPVPKRMCEFSGKD